MYVHFYIDLKEENQEANQEQEKAKKGKKGDRDKGRAQRGVPQFFQVQEKVEKEKAKFQKPEEAKNVFNNDLKTNQLDKISQGIIQP